MTGTDPLLAATPGEVEQGICREFLKHGFTADDPVLIDPDLISAVMTVVGPVLEAKDDEIIRQRTILRSAAAVAENTVGERLGVLEANMRASERVRCAAYLDSLGYPEAADALTLRPWIGVHDGDWIIKGPQGEFYPIRGDVFAETYEPAIPGEDGQP